MATNKDIIQKLECVETKLMSGELEEIHETVKEIKEVLLELRKLQGKVVKDWMTKAKGGVIDFFDLVRGFQSGDMRRAYPYEVEFLMSVLTKDKIIDRFRKYFGGKKAMNNRTASKK